MELDSSKWNIKLGGKSQFDRKSFVECRVLFFLFFFVVEEPKKKII